MIWFMPLLRSHRSRPHNRALTAGLIDIIESCQSEEAIERLRERHRPSLKALSRERPDLYHRLGQTIAGRSQQLHAQPSSNEDEQPPAPAAPPARRRRATKPRIDHDQTAVPAAA